MARSPGRTISLSDALVEIATHLSYSTFSMASAIASCSSTVHSLWLIPSFLLQIPRACLSSGILANCRLTSVIIFRAARPTACIASAENRNGNIAPSSSPAITRGSAILICVIFAVAMNAANRANAVRAADPIANPLPIAAVVFPTASSSSVRFRTSGGRPVISAIPPALSAIGP